ncbi:hypothetical protein RCL_jg6272.t1 [Rhizophagus clarus]|uniref:Uncharacterized protein n=1 Tax=Rhizophagus clarus TaxID=94130 RepID=A0A8H3L5H2_9GLOM|nr:hypothetical protein RCL_jg6272.t1 [Rhizophagus clarus]
MKEWGFRNYNLGIYVSYVKMCLGFRYPPKLGITHYVYRMINISDYKKIAKKVKREHILDLTRMQQGRKSQDLRKILGVKIRRSTSILTGLTGTKDKTSPPAIKQKRSSDIR